MKSTKSLKLNTIANYIGVGYTTLIGIVVFPLYLKYLGAEAFGLVGFFTILQASMHLLDMGMSPLLSRQVAHARSQKDGFLNLKKLLRSLELIVLILALIVVLGFVLGDDWIANQWLNITSLATNEVTLCILLMGAMLGLRLFSTLYRSGIRGMENQVRLNVANIILATLKFVGALLLLQFVSQNIVYFFVYQLGISIIELCIMATMFYRLMPSTDRVSVRFYWNALKPVLPFAAGIAYTAGIAVLLAQLDKIILSSVLPLSEFGYFALVVVVATAILKISMPIRQAILPRMSYFMSQGKEQEMLALYRKSSQLMSVIMLPLSGMIALFSTELLFAWTGDRKAAEWAGPILFWYALGNGIMTINMFQYHLQFVHEKLKLHVIYISILACIQIPVIIYTAFNYGAYGVAIVWFSIRLITFILWVPIVHSRLAPGIHWPWLLKDVAPILIMTAALLLFITRLDIDFYAMSQGYAFITLIGIGLIVMTANIFVSSASRTLVLKFVGR